MAVKRVFKRTGSVYYCVKYIGHVITTLRVELFEMLAVLLLPATTHCNVVLT
jgi:hypothetical protein